MTAIRPGNRFGPIVEAHGVRFQIWAPNARSVTAVIEDWAPVPLAPEEGGFWSCFVEGAGSGTRYRFDIDGRMVPDPASRFQPVDVDGPGEVIDLAAYPWRLSEWRGRPWREAVIYEAHVGVLGGYEGVRGRLAALARLGVTAIELMPLADFAGTRNWGYDGVLSFAPDCVYGRPEALCALVDAAHALGLMVLLDVVYNHFGPAGNFLPLYAPQFFDEHRSTPWGPAIDFARPEVRRFFTESARHWLGTYRLDGLRFDAVHAMSDRSWLPEMAASLRADFPDRHIHLVLENEENEADLLEHGFDAQWNDDFHNALHVILTGETHGYYHDFAVRPIERLARSLAEGFAYQGEASINRGGRPRGQPSAGARATAFVNFLQNHDQIGNRALGERLTVLVSAPALQAAMALLLLSPHIPLLFMGEEAGAREPFLFFTDFDGDLADAVREGRRNEFAGAPEFSEAARADIPDPNAGSTFSRSRWSENAPDARQWRELISALLNLRHTRIIPHLEGARTLETKVLSDEALLARWCLGDGSLLTLAANLGDRPAQTELPSVPPVYGQAALDSIEPNTTSVWIETSARP